MAQWQDSATQFYTYKRQTDKRYFIIFLFHLHFFSFEATKLNKRHL